MIDNGQRSKSIALFLGSRALQLKTRFDQLQGNLNAWISAAILNGLPRKSDSS
jgi:hypothetical protein